MHFKMTRPTFLYKQRLSQKLGEMIFSSVKNIYQDKINKINEAAYEALDTLPNNKILVDKRDYRSSTRKKNKSVDKKTLTIDAFMRD